MTTIHHSLPTGQKTSHSTVFLLNLLSACEKWNETPPLKDSEHDNAGLDKSCVLGYHSA